MREHSVNNSIAQAIVLRYLSVVRSYRFVIESCYNSFDGGGDSSNTTTVILSTHKSSYSITPVVINFAVVVVVAIYLLILYMK